MKRDDPGKDSTEVRPPARSTGKVPNRYRASIVIVQGYAQGMEYPVSLEYTVIGRDKAADIVIKDRLVSRQHAAIVFHDGQFMLKDLGSTNGTMLGSTLIEVANLHHKDKFRIGDTIIQFIVEDTTGGRIYEVG